MATTEQISPTTLAPLNPPRRLLFGPGPTMVDPRVYQVLSKPLVGHLDPYFIQVLEDVQQLLKGVFGIKEGFTIAISGTGSAGMEAAVANLIEPGMKFAVFANGGKAVKPYGITELRNTRDEVVYSRERDEPPPGKPAKACSIDWRRPACTSRTSPISR